MQFIDFEYSAPAPRGLDIASSFVEIPEGIFMNDMTQEFSPRKNFPKLEFIKKSRISIEGKKLVMVVELDMRFQLLMELENVGIQLQKILMM